MGLTEEQADKVLKGYEGYVSHDRFNEVNEAKKKAEATIAERDKQLKDLQKMQGDADALKQQIADLETKNKEAKKQYDAEIAMMKLDNAIRAEITNAHDVSMVAGLIDKTKVVIGEDGKLSGLTEQLTTLQKEKAFLFKSTQQYNPANGNNPNKNPFAKETWNMTEQGKLFRENPEQARALANAAGINL